MSDAPDSAAKATPTVDSADRHGARMKVIVVGTFGVGKTCLIRRYTKGFFDANTKSSIGVDFLSKVEDFDHARIKLQIWDTAGAEKFRTLMTAYYKGSNAALFVYSKCDASTFSAIDSYIDEAKDNLKHQKNTLMILVANKSDDTEKFEVTEEEGRAKASRYKMQYAETSAKSGENCDSVFRNAAQSFYNNNLHTNGDGSNKEDANKPSRPPRSKKSVVFINPVTNNLLKIENPKEDKGCCL